MPRSLQEILDHGDELARRFEDYEPDARDVRPVQEYLLERAALARARSERQIVGAVASARAKGIRQQDGGNGHGAPTTWPATPNRAATSGKRGCSVARALTARVTTLSAPDAGAS